MSQFQCGGWGTFLSEPLPIVALVGRYPANQLMGRIPIAHRNQPFVMTPCGISTASGIKLAFARLSRSVRQVGYALLTRAPVAIIGGQARLHAAPRLACVKPVASVHPEPGSNSSSYLSFLFLFFLHDAAEKPRRASRKSVRPNHKKRRPQGILRLFPRLMESFQRTSRLTVRPGKRVQKYALHT